MGIRDIFKIPDGNSEDSTKPTPEEQELMDRIAKRIVKWGMTVPAIMFLESVKPLNYIGSQVMVFFEPFVGAIFDLKDYTRFQQMMEKRHNVENLLLTIEKFDAEAQALERELKIQRKRNSSLTRKSWRQRMTFWKKN